MMSTLTAALFALLAVYMGGWWMDWWTGNFSGFLFILSVVTMAYWLAERFHFRPARLRAAAELERQDAQRRANLAAQGIKNVDGDLNVARERILAQPWWLDWTAGLFPVIVVVFVLRSFLFEPFKIPSGSMVPTLLVGDLILVNKYHYGVRLPVINHKIVPLNDPQRGDVMVFRFPPDPRQDYIKRVVGLPGDEVAYLNQKLSINGREVPLAQQPEFYDEDGLRVVPQFGETLGAVDHRILVDPQRSAFYGNDDKQFPFRDNCRYSAEGVVCKVPPGHYFMMGDNRDNSLDSRFWGFVPDENIVGKAFLIWMNFGSPGRIGTSIR
jgi:signal peptidase I